MAQTVREEEIWSCLWCHAATHVGGEWFEISRPPYLPVEMRWGKAVADGLVDGVSQHAIVVWACVSLGFDYIEQGAVHDEHSVLAEPSARPQSELARR
ncbi:hypothetical protein [Streptomyces chartreusis]|uniref:hypothetical protein n=1 Tax=Streptomyces chartreusis TaxID=1969 RepID=UPI00365E1697